MTAARLKERGESLYAFEWAGGRTGRLVWLDEEVREGRRTDWPGRPRGVEPRTRPPGQTAPTEAEPDAAAVGGVPFAHAARFVSVDPAENRARFYELRLQGTLWGGVALVRAWGREGTPGRARATEYPDRAAAGPDVARAVRRRLGRGYRLVEAR